MPRPELPDKKTLKVSKFFDIRGDYSQNLRIRKRENGIWQGEYLPEKADDIRPNQGRGNNGKRLTIRQTMGTDDPYEAAKLAVKWNQEHRKECLAKKEELEGKSQNTLHDYWNIYFQKESSVRETQRNFQRWKREESRKWNADEYGISKQSWANNRVDLINRSDFEDYFDLLQKRARKNNGTNGSGTKGEMKTLINKLLVVAEKDFPGHRFPSFPTISKEKKQVQHLTLEQWQLLMRTIFELGEGKEGKARTAKQYQALPFNTNNRRCVRNWVDLYDAMALEWFFYLRAEDMCRLKSEWFKRSDSGNWTCFLETTKKDRPLHATSHYRRDADSYLKRILGRKPNGYLVFPHMNRPVGNEAESGVLGNLNFLLKVAIEECLPDFPKTERKWTTIRHTAFRLTLEEMPELGVPPDINAFADNGHTSSQMLRDTYLRYIDAEKTASRARRKIQPTPNVRFGGKIKSMKDLEDS